MEMKQFGMETESEHDTQHQATTTAFDRTIDWVLGAVLGIIGVLTALGGATLYYSITRSTVADLVRNSEFESDVLTTAEAIEAVVAVGHWSGIGLVAGGGLILVSGIVVVIGHGRVRRKNRRTPGWILGIVGAVVGSLLSFIPFSPLFGGAVAAYLDPNPDASGVGPGALAGIFASLPILVVTIFAGVGLFLGVPPTVWPTVVVLLGIAAGIAFLYFVGVSAIGGVIGGWIRNE